MDAIDDPGIEQVVLMLSAQVGKSETLLNVLAKTIALDPCPILFLQPTLEMAESFSKERFAPMVRDTVALQSKIKDPRSRDSNNTLLHKNFPGGHLTFAGANSPASLASRPIRLLLCDEIDRYPVSAGAEGDPVSIAIRRTATFWNRKVFMVSTPTVKGGSRIEMAYNNSDRRVCLVPCPQCGQFQVLDWDRIEYPGKGSGSGAFQDVAYRCVACESLIPESEKRNMVDRHRWQITGNPGPVAGFHLNALYSPWQSWVAMARDYESATKEPLLLRVFVNTMLGLPWEDKGEGLEWESLMKRSRDSNYSSGQIPEQVAILTAGVDVQGDRLAVAIWGWAEESYLIEYAEIMGEPLLDGTWDILESYLDRTYQHPLGGTLKVSLACIDTGYLTQDVYGQVKKRSRWYAVKGKAGDRVFVSRPSWQELNWRGRALKRGIKLYVLGVDKAKELLYSRSRITQGDRCLHFPNDTDASWFEGFCSEVQVAKTVSGRLQYRWEKLNGIANEPLDTTIYALAAAELCGLSRLNWNKERDKLRIAAPVVREKEETLARSQEDGKPWVTKRRKRWIG